MQPFEILLMLIVLVCFLRPVFPGGWRWARILPAAGLVVMLAQVIIEGYRWQMIPLYFLVVCQFIFSLPGLFKRSAASQRPTWRKALAAGLGLLVTLLAAALPLLFPIPEGLPPGGAYPVGVKSMMLVDTDRSELYSNNPNEPRRIIAQVWYPAQEPLDGAYAPWMPDAEIVAPASAEWLGLPSFFFDHVRLVKSSSVMSAALAGAADQYPLLLFSHGYHGFRTQSTFLMQELASHGYVVVAVEHPYAAMITVFPDGSIAEHNPDTLPSGVTQAVYDQAARKLADQWAGDLSFVLDSLENPSGPFAGLAGRLDYGRIGALGHSTGGGSAIEFCSRDVRCKAVLGLDAWLVPVSLPVIEQGLEQPVFLIYSELWPTAENLSLAQSLRDRSPQNGQITILGTDHYDFTDMPLLSPLAPQLGLKGPLDGTRTLQIINAYSIAFFDQVLRNQVSPLLQEPVQEYPEVRWDGGD